MMRHLNTCLFLLLSFLAASCGTNPVTGKSELQLVSEGQEIGIGEQYYGYMQQAEGGDYTTDEEVQAYVARVGNKLASVSDRPDLPYEFIVLNNSIPNAWALPGGKIAIYRGLLNELQNEAELAAVLAHEIVHSAARHGAQAMERGLLMETGLASIGQVLGSHGYEDALMQGLATGAGLVHLKYSRGAELEADKYGIKYMVAAGYDPQAAIDLQKTFLRLSEGRNSTWLEGIVSTHPPSQERIDANIATAAQYPQGGRWGIKEYQAVMAKLKKEAPAYKDLDQGYEALMRGNSQKAIEFADKGLELAPEEAHLYNLKGKCLSKMRRYQEALSCFDKAIDLNDNYFDFYLQRGLLKAQMGKLSESRRDLDRSNALLPSAVAHNALGEIDLKEGDKRGAMRHFQIAGQANNRAGTEAREASGRLDSDNFNIIGKAAIASDQRVHISLTNENSYPVNYIVMEVTFYDGSTNLLSVQRFEYNKQLGPHQKVQIAFPKKAPTEALFAQVRVKRLTKVSR